MTDPATICTTVYRRFGQLKSSRSTYETVWSDLKDNLLPYHTKGLTGGDPAYERDRGERKDTTIYDGEPIRAVNVAAAGLQAGLTSPSRPWFSLGIPDIEAHDHREVRIWLADVEERMRVVFSRSNLYNSLHHLYLELLTFGTGAIGLYDSLNWVLRCRQFTLGEYWLGTDGEGRVNACYSQYTMTAAQLVAEFGAENVSVTALEASENNPDLVFTVLHAIEANDDRLAVVPRYPVRSIHLEQGATDRVLATRGYYEFPILVGRWHVVGQDTYGCGPGHNVLGDCKQVQKLAKQSLMALDKKVDPPMAAPGSLKTVAINAIPGGITYVDDPAELLRPLYAVDFDVASAEGKLHMTKVAVQRGLYNDLFLMLIQVDAGKMTATEVAERKQEKLLMLGPVLERLHNELLDPLIDRTFAMMLRAGMIPPPPQEIQGMPLRVQYVSPLALAQQQLAMAGLSQFLAEVGQLASVNPEVLDKVDFDEATDELARGMGVPPRVLRDDRLIAAIRQQRAAREQAQRMGQAALTAAKAAKDAAGAEPTEANILGQALGVSAV